jgi:hypothetical protein
MYGLASAPFAIGEKLETRVRALSQPLRRQNLAQCISSERSGSRLSSKDKNTRIWLSLVLAGIGFDKISGRLARQRRVVLEGLERDLGAFKKFHKNVLPQRTRRKANINWTQI